MGQSSPGRGGSMNEVVERLSDLVRIPSVSSMSNLPLVEYVIAALDRAKWQTREVAYIDSTGTEKLNLIAAPPGQDIDDSRAELAFACHTDTVPYSDEWPEATSPFVADGMVHGCGACDVKGFLACLLTASSQIAPSMFCAGLRLLFTADEEIGCIGMTRLLESGLVQAKRVIVGEPTSLHVARAGKGYCLAKITVFGREAHSALPQSGKSAIFRAAQLINAIEEFGKKIAQEQNELFDPGFTTINIGTIHGGTAKNIIPRECTFQLEWRPIPGQSADTLPAAVSRKIERLTERDPDFRCNIEIVRRQDGFETSVDSNLVRSLSTLGGRQPTTIPFASEASLLGRTAEEVVVFGPGDMRTAHSRRECVPVIELEEAVTILKSLMTDRIA